MEPKACHTSVERYYKAPKDCSASTAGLLWRVIVIISVWVRNETIACFLPTNYCASKYSSKWNKLTKSKFISALILRTCKNVFGVFTKHHNKSSFLRADHDKVWFFLSYKGSKHKTVVVDPFKLPDQTKSGFYCLFDVCLINCWCLFCSGCTIPSRSKLHFLSHQVWAICQCSLPY